MRRLIRGSLFSLFPLFPLACLAWPAPAEPATPVDLELVREIAEPQPGANPIRQLAVTGP